VEQKRTEIRESIFVKSRKYKKYMEMTRSRDIIVKTLKKRKGLLKELETGLLPVEEENRAKVFMQELISNYVDDTMLTMTSLRPLERIEFKYYRGIPVQITVTGDMGRISEFLQKIINSKYLISIDLLNIRVINIRDPYKVRMRGHFTGYIRSSNPAIPDSNS
jgi:Tfp pilus assembly protein PilO